MSLVQCRATAWYLKNNGLDPLVARILPFIRPVQAEAFIVKTADGNISTNPMRRMIERLCEACEHVWQQPSDEGACPRCHSTTIINGDETICGAPYRK